MNLEAALAIEISVRLIACSVALGALESLWLWSRGHFHPQGLWSWQIVGEVFPYRLATLATPLMGYQGVLGFLLLRLACACLVVLLPYQHALFTVSLAGLVGVHLLMTLRMPFGGEGSDQMTLVVLIPGILARWFAHDAVAVTSAVLFVGAQITLCYLGSGVTKAKSAQWRSGEALGKIMNHHTYGNLQFAQLLRAYPALGRALNYFVIFFQASFFLFYFIPMPFALLYVAVGVGFHAAVAYCMRLNQFFIVFVGTYPCLIFTHEYVRQFIFG